MKYDICYAIKDCVVRVCSILSKHCQHVHFTYTRIHSTCYVSYIYIADFTHIYV